MRSNWNDKDCVFAKSSALTFRILASLIFTCCSLLYPPISAYAAPYKVAAVTFDPAWGDLDANISRLMDASNQAADRGAKLIVFPEMSTTGYIFDDLTMIEPFLDTIPGKTTDALSQITKKSQVFISVGIAEIDQASGLAYNSVALIGPEGYIGKYRKVGLNSQDQHWASQGNLGFPVFDTSIGRITLLICYDDTYWQYSRLALLHDADIIAWSSASDRVMPGTSYKEARGDHSTIANVQHLAAFSGAWVVAATRNGIEINPKTNAKLYYNGGSSIWDPSGHNINQAPVTAPMIEAPGVNNIILSEINPSDSGAIKTKLLALRRPEIYKLLAIHRTPLDTNATSESHKVKLSAEAISNPQNINSYKPPAQGGLIVLPALFRYGTNPDVKAIEHENNNGFSEQFIARLAKKGRGYVAGSYAESSGSQKAFHTVALAGPDGRIIGRYRETHPQSGSPWANPGDQPVVISTPIGRIGLLLAEETSIPETFGILSALRADIIAAPGQALDNLHVEIDPKLFKVLQPSRVPFYPYIAATLGQAWLVTAGWTKSGNPSTWVFGPDPVISTPAITNTGKATSAFLNVTVPWQGTWINQEKLIIGQTPNETIPLVLKMDSDCFKKWKTSSGWNKICW